MNPMTNEGPQSYLTLIPLRILIVGPMNKIKMAPDVARNRFSQVMDSPLNAIRCSPISQRR